MTTPSNPRQAEADAANPRLLHPGRDARREAGLGPDRITAAMTASAEAAAKAAAAKAKTTPAPSEELTALRQLRDRGALFGYSRLLLGYAEQDAAAMADDEGNGDAA